MDNNDDTTNVVIYVWDGIFDCSIWTKHPNHCVENIPLYLWFFWARSDGGDTVGELQTQTYEERLVQAEELAG